jgi:large repetitive protein
VRSGVRLTGWLAAIGLLLLLIAPGAGAATGPLTWSEPGTFTTGSTGANPDHDSFGAKPWAYEAAAPGTTSFTPLGTYSAGGVDGGLDAWTDSAGTAIGTTPSSAAVTSGTDTFSSGQLAMSANTTEQAALVWNSPLPSSDTVTVSGTVAPADSSTSCGTGLFADGGYTWTLEQNGTTVASGTSSASGTITATPLTVAQGGSLALVIAASQGVLGSYATACSVAEVELTLTTPATAPAVTLAAPVNNSAYVTPAQPTFTGTAGTAFGDSGTVQVKIYAGASSAPTGTPLQTLSATVSGGNWSVTSAPLVTGVYTGVASQSDLATPADTSTASSEFVVDPQGSTGSGSSGGSGSGAGGSGSFVLNAPTSEPVTTLTPTLSGAAPTADAGDAVAVAVFKGTSASGTAERVLDGTIAANGTYSVQITPALTDGAYTAEAAASFSGTLTETAPVEFTIKTSSPELTMVIPTAGGNSSPKPVFLGAAGDETGDASTVTVTLYQGVGTGGTSLGTEAVQRSGASWSAQWPHTLKLGFYTAYASQADDISQTTQTKAHTFLVVPAPKGVIGSSVTVAQDGLISVAIYCPATYPQYCKGTTTVRPASGAAKKLTLIKKSYEMYGSLVVVVRAQMRGSTLRTMRRLHRLNVKVTTAMAVAGAKKTYTATRRVTVPR